MITLKQAIKIRELANAPADVRKAFLSREKRPRYLLGGAGFSGAGAFRRGILTQHQLSKYMSKIKVIIGTLIDGLIEGKPPIINENGKSRCAIEISHEEVCCDLDTSCRGEILSSKRCYNTPWGVCERRYKAWGGSLEYSSVTFRIVGGAEIAEKAAAAQRLAVEAQAAAEELKRFQLEVV